MRRGSWKSKHRSWVLKNGEELSKGQGSSDPFYQPNHKYFEVSPQPHHIFLHFTIHLVSSNWIASHPSYNCQTSVVCCLDLLAMLLALSLLVSVISPFVCWWCRQQWHLSVRKENSDTLTPAICCWLQVVVSDGLLWWQFGFLIWATGSRNCAPQLRCFSWHRSRVGQRERWREGGLEYSQGPSLNCGRLALKTEIGYLIPWDRSPHFKK